MPSSTSRPAAGLIQREEVRGWVQKLAGYRQSSPARSLFELAITIVPFAILWSGMIAAVLAGQYWLFALLALPTAGFLVRMFMIQHDCGHGSFFADQRWNDRLGRLIGVLTMTPYDHWRRSHAIHHASAGNLDRRGIGDVDTLTISEYRSLSRLGRLRYRMYRHPLVMFGFGPFYLFVLQNRLPIGFMRRNGRMPWISTMGTNVGIVVLGAAAIWAVGLVPFVIVHGTVIVLAATIGVWLFYVQHQFEETLWDEAADWSVHEAALHGSSHYDLPPILRWFTANIGVHHVHHLSSRIPSYRLQEVLRDHPELRGVGRLTLWQSLACVRLVLWDEEARRLVSFREAGAKLARSVDHAAPVLVGQPEWGAKEATATAGS
jgi:acyl-lipid omega-6 desaturase (Delta-12 desaturase)